MRVLVFIVPLLFVLIPPGPVRAELPAICAQGSYVSPMHPQHRGEAGDNCPVCGMAMVPDPLCYPEENHDAHSHHDAMNEGGGVYISPAFRQALGVRMAEVSRIAFGHDIRAYGTIVPDMRREHQITLRAAGWLSELAASAEGDFVQKGDLLFTLYSPDLMAAQSDYLVDRRNSRMTGDPARRLRLFGMDEAAIALLRERGEMLEQTPFYAPADGTVAALPVRAGAYVPEGQLVMTLQDYSHVWVMANVALRDLGFLKEGARARVKLAGSESWRVGRIDFIDPAIDAASRTGSVRIELPNPRGDLRPGLYGDVRFDAESHHRLAVPEQAVLYGAGGAYVLRDRGGGHFAPQPVVTGIRADGHIEIRSGLSHGDRIVTSGQFMIDAEANLRGAMSGMDHDHSSREDGHAH